MNLLIIKIQEMQNTGNKKPDWINYRQLQENEIIEAQDEVYNEVKDIWVKTSAIGTLAPNPNYMSHRIYRRKRIF